MPWFVYEAVAPGGEVKKGEIEGRTKGEALQKLGLLRLQPHVLRPKEGELAQAAASRASEGKAPAGSTKLSRKQILLFTDEVSDLLEAGLRLEPALRVMEDRRELSGLKRVVARMREQVREGVGFSVALRNASASFGELYCRLVAAGEASGALPVILKRQAAYLAAMGELRSRVIQALIYPAFISGAGILLMCIFMTVLVPQLTVLFTKTGQQLPIATQILIAVSAFGGKWWWAVLLAILFAALAFRQFVGTPSGRLWWDRKQLGIPLVGDVLATRHYVQIAQTLATMVGNGVPLFDALRLMEAAMQNIHLKARLGKVAAMVGEGVPLSRAMDRIGEFPAILIDTVSIGEQTGDLADALEKAGRRYDKELNVRIQRMTSMVQPIIVLAMALVVGTVAFSMITGIFDAVSSLKTR